MRRLPVFFVIDVSESMVGDPIQKVEEGLRMIVTALKKDPYALETVYISIIVFAGKAKTLVPLTDIISFYPPKFQIGAGTSYGAAIRHLISEINSNVQKTTRETKGDWKPIIFFMTDGNPTDDYVIDVGVWEQKWKDNSNSIVVSIGDGVDAKILRRISDDVIAFDESDAESFTEFFKWVTASIKTQSQKVEEEASDGKLNLSGFDKSKLKKIDPFDESSLKKTDEQYVIFHGKCQNKNAEYLIKYKKRLESMGFVDMPQMRNQVYRLEGSYLLNEGYRELSTEASSNSNARVSTEHLRGMPNCPACGNRFALCICQCGGIFCVDGGGQQTCPHCHQVGMYGSGDGHIDIDRKQG